MGPEEQLWGISDPICLVFLFNVLAYYVFMEAYVGWTVGKKILGMQVADVSGNRIGVSKSIIRNLPINIPGASFTIAPEA